MTSEVGTLDDRLLLPPLARAAYSDRTAWLMAEMARLAYEKFEAPGELLEALVDSVASLDDPKRIHRELDRYFRDLASHDRPGLERLREALGKFGFELVATLDNGGTQAFIAKRSLDKLLVLAFRGTERDFRDIKTDINVRFYTRGNTRIHSGFLQAYRLLEERAVSVLSEYPDYKMYITGHSLGGALALVAASRLSADNVAACYTYGSPKVGNLDFGFDLKIPVYRVVNSADLVPRLPPTWTWEIVIVVAYVLPIPGLRGWLLRVLNQLRGYRHHGDMRYLTDDEDDGSEVHLIANPNLFDRGWRLVLRLITNFGAGFRDHRMDNYCRKLRNYADGRAVKSQPSVG